MAQASRHADITEQHSVRRAKFEADSFPHLDALWRTALWLTMRSSLAENLVLTTITRAYREWQDSRDVASSKARLFRMLTREFFGSGTHRRRRQPFTLFHSENITTTAGPQRRNPQHMKAGIRHSQLPLLAGISHVAVKGVIARLRPLSRLLLILLYRERFSYADIGYITALSVNTIKAMLSRLRRLIPGYIFETAACATATSEGQSMDKKDGGAFDRLLSNASLKFPSLLFQEMPANAAEESWENEGGAVVSQEVE